MLLSVRESIVGILYRDCRHISALRIVSLSLCSFVSVISFRASRFLRLRFCVSSIYHRALISPAPRSVGKKIGISACRRAFCGKAMQCLRSDERISATESRAFSAQRTATHQKRPPEPRTKSDKVSSRNSPVLFIFVFKGRSVFLRRKNRSNKKTPHPPLAPAKKRIVIDCLRFVV